MTFTEARKLLWGGQQLTREHWPEDFYVEAAHTDTNRKLKLIDSTGRNYGVSVADESADDWVIWEG